MRLYIMDRRRLRARLTESQTHPMNIRYHSAWLVVATFILAGFMASQSLSAQEPFWFESRGPYGGSVNALTFTPTGAIVAGTTFGVYRSTNGGTNWSPVAPALRNARITSLITAHD